MKQQKIVVLGTGLVGSAIAIDLNNQYDVTAVDISEETLNRLKSEYNIKTIIADLSTGESIKRIVQDFDLVISAVPGFMGYNTVKNVIGAGKNMVDISFFPQDPFELDGIAKEQKVTIITDCGVAPGMANIILGYHNHHMKVNRYECLIGGLPFVREWPYEYKAVFSPIDVIEEYIRPARYIENGGLVVKEALSDPEYLGENEHNFRYILTYLKERNVKYRVLEHEK